MFTRIAKGEARRRFEANQPFVMCPHKLRPGYPWASHSTIFPTSFKPTGMPELWDSFEAVENSWSYYNTSWEAGYYAHFYVES